MSALEIEVLLHRVLLSFGGRAGHRGRPDQDRVPQPRLSLKKSFAENLVHFLGGRLSLYNKA